MSDFLGWARRADRRRALLAADAVLTRADNAYVRARRPRSRRLPIDSMTGRTPRLELEATLLGPTIWSHAADAVEQGAAVDDLVAGVAEVSQDAGARIACQLLHTAPSMLREHAAERRGFDRRMRAVWGPGLDAVFTVYVAVEELGSDLQQLHQDLDDDTTEAVLALQARCALILAEVHALLAAGFPLGAFARARSLHETAVVAAILGEYGRERGLAERYLAHAVIDQARDVQAEINSGIEHDSAFLAEVMAARDEVLLRFGAEFKYEYGWARPLFPELRVRDRISYTRLELLAATGLDRLGYRTASHHVHSSARTLALNRFERAGRQFRLTGPTNIDFVEPAAYALEAATMTTWAVVHGVSDDLPEPLHIAGTHAISVLAATAVERLLEGQNLVMRREGRLQRCTR